VRQCLPYMVAGALREDAAPSRCYVSEHMSVDKRAPLRRASRRCGGRFAGRLDALDAERGRATQRAERS
jgi:hypothetical protein